MKDLGDTYEGEVISAVISAVIEVRSDGTGNGGVIDPERTFRALCSAIGIMANNIELFDKPADRRAFADKCRKDIVVAINAAADPSSGLGWMRARPLTDH